MASLDVPKLLSDIAVAAQGILKKDLASVQGFSERQLRDLAEFAALVTTGIATGTISKDAHPFLLQSLEDMTEHFVKVLQGLAVITVEKLVNAVLSIVVKAVETAAGVTLRAV